VVSSILVLQLNQTTKAALIDPHPGLVGWWRFDEGTGSLAEDSSGNGNDGTVHGASWIGGKYGNASSFDGINDYIEVASLPDMTTITIEAWINKADMDSVGSHIIICENPVNQRWIFLVQSGVLILRGGALGSDLTYTMPNTDGVWYYVAGVIDGVDGYLYVNGLLVNSGTVAAIGTGTGAVNIGRYSTGGFWDGFIDEVRVYNRARSETEIQESFQEGPEFSSKLLAKVPEGSTQIITTVSWEGAGNIDITVESSSESYSEEEVPVYQKTTYSPLDGETTMLNIKRVSISVAALSSDENWDIILDLDDVEDYRITVEIQK
jgi:hypothetical protein